MGTLDSSDKVLDLVTHLFLLKRLPNSEQPNLPSIELGILDYLSRISGPILQQNDLLKCSHVLQTWMDIQGRQTNLNTALGKLMEGESACLFVRKQNCTIHFRKLNEKHMRVITFRASLPNEYITGTCGSLKVTYPETLDVVPISPLLLSPCFSNQLDHLTVNLCSIAMPTSLKQGQPQVETRDTSHPYMVSDFLVGLQCPVGNSGFGNIGDIEKIKFQKKLRDQVNWESGFFPFRRSGLWTSVKVILQLSLNEEMKSKEDARLMYKIIIQELLISVAEKYSQIKGASWDICAQIMTKLARRAKKLSEMRKIDNGNNLLLEQTLEHTCTTVGKIHGLVSEQWISTATSEAGSGPEIRKVKRDKRLWIEDCIHQMDNLTKYLNQDRTPPIQTDAIDNLKMIDSVIQTQTVTLDDLLSRYKTVSGQQQDIHLNEISVWIYQVEWFARHGLHSGLHCGSIYDLLLAYLKKASHLTDPVYYSRYTITALKFIAVLDEIAVEKHPLLRSYLTGILPEMFNHLLIPEKYEMKLVEDLQSYFRNRNYESAASTNGHEFWLKNSKIGDTDFCVKYAQQNGDMKQLKEEILEKMEKDIEAKEKEIEQAKSECSDLQTEINSLSCSSTWSSYYEKYIHNNNCNLCSLRAQLERRKVSVKRYQRPLPSEDYLRDAVVFEFLIPKEIVVLRESVGILLEEILGIRESVLFPFVKKIFKKWADFHELNEFDKNGNQNLLHLGSQGRDALTDYSGVTNPDVVRSSSRDFILENNMDCTYYRTSALNQQPENPFTLKIAETQAKDAETYKSLQFSLYQKPPTENQVLAWQNDCHQNITLKEFKMFGSLRSAPLVQLRNLYTVLASQILSLEKEPTIQLTMQTLWELGPGKRDTHADFELPESKQFALAFLELLRTSAEENATNWSNPTVFLSFTFVVVRILEMNDCSQVKETASRVLQRYRAVLEEWCIKLEALLVKTPDRNDAKALMDLLLKSALCCAFTFNVSAAENMPYIFKNSSDIAHFLHALSRLHHLVVRENILTVNPISSFMNNLLRYARHTIPLNVHDYLNLILYSPHFNLGLHKFVCSKWNDARKVHTFAIPTFLHSGNQSSLKKHAYQADYLIESIRHKVCVDILRGTFFVDGYPPSVLPEKILRNPLFKSFFRTSQFRVQRDSQTFKTTDKYCGLDFEFTDTDKGLIIRQLSPQGQWYELLPRELLHKNLPRDLISNFTHWFSSNHKVVHFRRPSSLDNEENIEHDTDYLLVPVTPKKGRRNLQNEWHLTKYTGATTTSNVFLLSINSIGFQEIIKTLQKLEDKTNIHVLLNKADGRISANLWSINLSFSLNHDDGLLYGDNYPGYYVPTSEDGGQSLGTLVGLQSGILLEKRSEAEPSGKKKIFLIQHGTVSISHGESDLHQSVKITGGNRSPSYLVFEIDQVLKRLRPGSSKSAWLYLALLHGATSSPFPDPFTQLTGTEMAIYILQSGFAWSCSPYDAECRTTLNQISNLSPNYEYYPEHLKVMEKVIWPGGLSKNFFAAYDGYSIIVQKLLNDSVRLQGLFPENPSSGISQLNLELCKRSYYRNINMYNKATHLSIDFVEDSKSLQTRVMTKLPSVKVPAMVNGLNTLAQYRLGRIPSSNTENVASFIMTSTPLPSNTEDTLTVESITTWLDTDLHENWLQLYSLALTSTEDEMEHELTMILGAMLYSGKGSLEQLLNLHTIAICHYENDDVFPSPPKTLTKSDYSPLKNDFEWSSIFAIVEKAADSPPSQNNFETYAKFTDALGQYKSSLKQQASLATDYLRSNNWPTESIEIGDLQRALAGKSLLNFSGDALEKINSNLKNWYNNLQLKLFIVGVDEVLTSVKDTASKNELRGNRVMKWNLQFKTIPDTIDNWPEEEITSDGDSLVAEANRIASTGQLGISHLISLGLQRSACIELSEIFAKKLDKITLGNDTVSLAFDKAGLNTRTAPINILRVIILPHHSGALRQSTESNEESCIIGALVVIWANLKRLNRLIMYNSNESKYSVELARELKTRECENWNPMKNPEWLLLELELDITIRSVQVDVATQMMKMRGEKNGVMQLNMGEGKTSVIIPMIVAALSNQKDVLCRVTVLNSIFATNYNLLGVTIGGFLNKRLYTVPCNRDLDIVKYLGPIEEIYKECVRLGGAVITLPEYRLSFRLQMYNNFLPKGKEEVPNFSAGLKIHKVESWLRKYARDLVDESDEIFSVKYQLIYTTGKQEKVDCMRWTVCQKLLEFLPQVAAQLFQKYGTEAVEFQPEKAKNCPHKFTHFRILSEEFKQELNKLMADGILKRKVNLIDNIFREDESKLMEFLTNENISEEEHNKFLEIEDIPTEKLSELLLVSGYLRRGILFAALKKRWRVEYGVKKPSLESQSKLMAVPFKAKDVAADRTEFGHPDMAIVLTQLSYYYSGLTDEQLMQCFEHLSTKITGPETMYNSWIKKVPLEEIKSDTVKTYKGINLQDYEQRTYYLFPLLRKHKAVVDFWLENVAYPKECKQFPGKLVTNAWDLCYHRNTHATTGFSGTNDTSLLLPAQITQQDYLKALLKTNKEVEETLKRTENQWKRSLEMGVTCQQVIEFMTEDKLRVLIDAGALMLQLGNEEIAKLWLDTDKSLDAVVYFSENGEMVVKLKRSAEYEARSKGEMDQPLTLSPYKDSLDNCAIYLDDQHTRGTDIKLPTNFNACVTIGSGMRRDKLIQACMRMRKLGKGQSVHFYLSHEVHNKISLQTECNPGNKITVTDIINWTTSNSKQFEKDGLMYWATNARNYAKNLAADDLFELATRSKEDAENLVKRCKDKDAQDLKQMYGTYHRQILLTTLIPMWFSRIVNQLSPDHTLEMSITQTLKSIERSVMDKCKEHIPNKTFFNSMLEEEQEKELEPEVEEEPEKYRPPRETPLEPKLHPNVKRCVTRMNTARVMDGISRLSDIFEYTKIKSKLQENEWGVNWFATEDFIKVIDIAKSNGVKYNDDEDEEENNMGYFLRSIRFFVSFNGGSDTTILILSLHEVNSLVSFLRERKCSHGTTLHMFSGRWMDGQPMFANESRLQLPFRTEEEATSLNENVMAPLLIAEGNLYFSSLAEQEAFAKFLGLRLRPWTDEENRAVAEKKITTSGFVLPSCQSLREGYNFENDPTDLIMEILKLRNDALRDSDHAVSILKTGNSSRT